jgi:translation initiation factor 4E
MATTSVLGWPRIFGKRPVSFLNFVLVPMHPLETAWTLYYQRPQPDLADYSLTIHKIGQFNTVEDFWSYFSHLKRVTEISDPMEYHLFREDIRGMWEDEVNRTGGKWILFLKKQYSAQYWEKAVISLIGEAMHEDVVGAIIAVHDNVDVLSFWTRTGRTGSNDQHITDIVASIARALGLPQGTCLKFKNHYETKANGPKALFSYTVRGPQARKPSKGSKSV